jgi:RNA polymerase sigma-B factor
MNASPDSEYTDVAEMFRRLQALEADSPAFRRQREAIVQRTLPLADHIARRFRNRGETLDDLTQAARIGLVKAVDRFDIDCGTDFLGFAVPTIMGEVRRHFRDYGWAVKVPRRLKDLQGQLNRSRAELTHRLGRSPSPTELADHLGIDRETVVEATIASSNYTTASTDLHFGRQDDERPDVTATYGVIDANLDKVLDVHTVRPLIAALPEREQTVLRLRFFENMSQTAIAAELGCSQMHVSRLLARALATIRSGVDRPVALSQPDLASTA